MKKYNLFLDDERVPYSEDKNVLTAYYYDKFDKFKDEEWEIVRDFNQFVEAINQKMPKFISFDNDLGYGLTGYDCAKWLVNYCLIEDIKIPEYHVHSMNHVDSKNIISYIENYKKTIENELF